MFGTKYLNDEHDCNVISTNSLNILDTNDDCTSYDVSYKHVNWSTLGVLGTQETLCYLVAGLLERDHIHPTPPTD